MFLRIIGTRDAGSGFCMCACVDVYYREIIELIPTGK